MKLCYYKSPRSRNFGDDLNPWLWEKLIPGILDDDSNVAFVGIGTLINDLLPRLTNNAEKLIIFGSGVGYGTALPKIDESFKIYCVRGPLSAQALGLPEKLAVTDGAILLRKVFSSNAGKIYPFSYMPHWQNANKDWELACENLGITYIDPGWTVDKVLSYLSQTEILLTEAMHGAIVADALRVPWVPISTHPRILSFKWNDWCSTIGVKYQPINIQKLEQPKNKESILRPILNVRNWGRRKKAEFQLKQVLKHHSPFLSQDSRIETLTTQLEDRLDEFKQDVKSGLFSR